MNRDDDQHLWDLLGQGRTPEVSPFFARNVIREIRATSTSGRGRWGWPLPRTAAFGAIAALVLTVATFTLIPHGSRVHDGNPDVVVTMDLQDNDLLADLDDSAPADDSLWDDDDAVTL